MMKETNIHSQVTSTIAGDDGEAVAKSEQNAKKKVPEKPNEGLEKPADAGWYVAVVRVNCETRIADSIRIKRVCHKSMAHPLLCYLLHNPRSIVAYSKKGII